MGRRWVSACTWTMVWMILAYCTAGERGTLWWWLLMVTSNLAFWLLVGRTLRLLFFRGGSA